MCRARPARLSAGASLQERRRATSAVFAVRTNVSGRLTRNGERRKKTESVRQNSSARFRAVVPVSRHLDCRVQSPQRLDGMVKGKFTLVKTQNELFLT